MKNQKGITLVALIITIIVMVILAGVIITSAVVDGGVIDKAKEAIRENERAEIEDLIIASYVYKTTASTNAIAVLDLGKTGAAIYENLTANGFILKDTSGNEFDSKEEFVAGQEDNKIDINVEGEHGEYTGEIKEDGLDGEIDIKDENNLGGNSKPEYLDGTNIRLNTPYNLSGISNTRVSAIIKEDGICTLTIEKITMDTSYSIDNNVIKVNTEDGVIEARIIKEENNDILIIDSSNELMATSVEGLKYFNGEEYICNEENKRIILNNNSSKLEDLINGGWGSINDVPVFYEGQVYNVVGSDAVTSTDDCKTLLINGYVYTKKQESFTFTIGELAERGLLSLESEDGPTVISTKNEFFPETVSEELKNSEYVWGDAGDGTILKCYNITCSNEEYINSLEQGDGSVGTKNFIMYLVDEMLILAVSDENGNMIKAHNYENYKNLTFTLSMPE